MAAPMHALSVPLKDNYFWLNDETASWQNVQLPYSQHLNFFVTYEWAQQASVFVRVKPFKLSLMEHSSLLGPFVSYGEKKCCEYNP